MVIVAMVFVYKNSSLHQKIENKNINISKLKQEGKYLNGLRARYNKKNADKKMNNILNSSGFDGQYIQSSISKKKARIKIDVQANELNKIHKLSNKILSTSWSINSLSIKTKDDYNKTFAMDVTF
jgi:hypothetical protein